MHRHALAMGTALLVLAESVHAQVYKWVDERGVTHYSEQPPATAKARTAKKLDIVLQGNDLPAAAQECGTIRCQYERLRKDRLEREAERRAEDESRAAAAPPPPPPASTGTVVGTGWIDPGYPIYRRPLVVRPLPLPMPGPGSPSSPVPAGGSRTPAGIGVR